MASCIPSLEPAPDTCPEFKRRKRRIPDQRLASSHSHQRNQRIKRWRTQREQHIYSSKLIQALRRSRLTSTSSSTVQEVHDTADRVLAVLAKGTTRWSRAILTARKMSRQKKAKAAANTRLRKPAFNMEKRKTPVIQRKLKVLGRLVPGCRKLSFSNLIEETSDYIAALEMQVRAMTAITEFLAGYGPQRAADRLASNANS
ncbi:hypothetical protein F3Y22_tig00110393pilonHSYRG00153 [Hibiscus syriacus]|uniref:BHLH domain-containing protein n=1 Tax=Hibiscus syriacus TaxID=106335 RepID=A0A6A3AP88_HIBSY|nr:transcription factor bHLH149-like [Hibiscus syriacus]KAE8706430.1 hypothetical protein F3Y22_tig00110393pilonHSYRG00153 [Hibiscus syriacus]